MTLQDILDQLSNPSVPVDRLLDESRAPDLSVWQNHRELYPVFVKRLLARGHLGLALELDREGERYLQNDSRLQYLLALAAARGGSVHYAEALLAPLLARAAGMDTALRVDVIALKGRLTDAPPDASWYQLRLLSRPSHTGRLVSFASEKVERPASNAELVEGPQLPPRLATVVQPGNHARVLGEERPELFRRFAQEVDTEAGDAKFAHPAHVLRAALRHAVVDRVPTAGIDVNREQCAGTVF